jgi:hypothetical protein
MSPERCFRTVERSRSAPIEADEPQSDEVETATRSREYSSQSGRFEPTWRDHRRRIPLRTEPQWRDACNRYAAWRV